jgi:hypothetical protein
MAKLNGATLEDAVETKMNRDLARLSHGFASQ